MGLRTSNLLESGRVWILRVVKIEVAGKHTELNDTFMFMLSDIWCFKLKRSSYFYRGSNISTPSMDSSTYDASEIQKKTPGMLKTPQFDTVVKDGDRHSQVRWISKKAMINQD